MSLAEEIEIKNTKAFIAENPSIVNIIRRRKEPTREGGWKRVQDVVLGPQTCRIVMRGNNAGRGDAFARTSADGRPLVVIASAVFSPDEADVQIGDKFEAEDKWEVTGVSDVPRWRVSAEVSSSV